MLPVSTVYIAWRHGDMVDAYLPDKGHQVIFIQRLNDDTYSVYFLVYMSRLSSFIMQGIAKSTLKLRIEEGQAA